MFVAAENFEAAGDAGQVPLSPSRQKRFYEPVILLDALRSIYLKANQVREPDLEAAAGKSPKQIFFCFVNKLSQICDNEPRQPLGKTVTAFSVLDSGTIEYRFASNQRSREELDAVAAYVTGILRTLGDVPDDRLDDKAFMAQVSSGILKRILAFNRPRIELYLHTLLQGDRLAFCIESSAADGTREGLSVSQALRRLKPHAEAARDAPGGDNDEFASHVETLLHAIDAHYRSCLEAYMMRKTRGDNVMPDSPWSDVRHALGRLLSYFIAVKVLVRARDLWPRVFVDFEMNHIASSKPWAEPPNVRRNAKGIIDRMGRNRETMDAYQRYADVLQEFRLDERIRERVRPLSFGPIVHAEVNLLDSIQRDRAAAEAEGDGPLRFFNEAEFGGYVGCSKPSCLLCSFYFAAHPSGVQCRGTHGNLYYNWRPPPVFRADGREAEQQRDAIVESMIRDVRHEAARAIKDRCYTRRRHDSRDTPSNPLWSTVRGSTVRSDATEADDLASRLGQISLDHVSVRNWAGSSRETTPERARALGGDVSDDDDDGGGGVRL